MSKLSELEQKRANDEQEILHIEEELKLNIAGRLSRKFIFSPLTPILAIAVLIAGLVAIFFTPREENPQIDIPAANLIISYPGASTKEVQEIIIEPLSRILKEINGVEDVYGMAGNSFGVVTVRFFIGEDKERSLIKLYDRVMQNLNILPHGVNMPIFKPIDIDEVPIVTIALSSKDYSEVELYKVAQRFLTPIGKMSDVSIVNILGGEKRQFNILIDPIKLSSYQLSIEHVVNALKSTNVALPLGTMDGEKYSLDVEFNSFIKSFDDLKNIVISASENRLIYLTDIAIIEDGTSFQEKHSTAITLGEANSQDTNFKIGEKLNQVTVYASKKRGTNAVFVAEDIVKVVESLQKDLPKGIDLIITRDDGVKANDAVNELIHHLVIAVIVVVILLVFMLGLKEALIVSVAIPLVLSITLFIGMLADQSINRITLFALILSLGLLVDDAIVVVENIHRRFAMGVKNKTKTVISATNEIGNPTTLATMTVILSFIPMAYVGGMMGPYMAPIPFNVPIAMIASLMVAYIFTPWASNRYLTIHHNSEPFSIKSSKIYTVFNAILRPMVENRWIRYMFMFFIIGLFFVSLALPALKIVQFKMLPGANKNTFNITIDLPNGSSIKESEKSAVCVEEILKSEKEISDFETFVGFGGVIDFNGLLRGASMKKGENVAEIRVNLKHKDLREESSIDLVSRLRPKLQECSRIANANIKLVEDPPGPPVLATLLIEVTGESDIERRKFAEKMKNIYSTIDGVVDIDILADDLIAKYSVIPDLQKAKLAGISVEEISRVISVGFGGAVVSTAHINDEKEQIGIFVRFQQDYRDELDDFYSVKLFSPTQNRVIPLSEITRIEKIERDELITSKNLNKITMITAELDKRGSVYALLDIFFQLKDEGLDGYKIEYDGNPRLNLVATNIETGAKLNLIWSGEWKITFDVFRDLGSAFGVAVILIYILLLAYYGKVGTPGIVLVAIPLTFIGVLPGHAIMDIFTPTYFTATSMIGFIALAGIVVRNSLLLVDFTNELIAEGKSLNDAMIEGAATRFRPIILTALAIILASLLIVLDPVWQGLAVALIFGVAVSTVLSLFVVPLLYWKHLRKLEQKKEKLRVGLKEIE